MSSKSVLNLFSHLAINTWRLWQTADVRTLIIAEDVMRNSVARSLTGFILAATSAALSVCSRSTRARCSDEPCLWIRSLHVRMSSSFELRVRRTFCSSSLSGCAKLTSSSTMTDRPTQTDSYTPMLKRLKPLPQLDIKMQNICKNAVQMFPVLLET